MLKILLNLSLTLTFALHARAATITIGGQIKNTIGTVVDANQGDVACYLTLKDDAGKSFDESADFDLCTTNRLRKGQRVQLTYGMVNVQSAACQGNPDCKKTDRIALVTYAKVIGGAPAATPAPKAPVGKQASFCTANETIIFTCNTGAKRVSVCASRNVSPKAGYVQYRFGIPGSPDKPGEPLEITLPASEVHPLKAAYGTFDPYAGGGASWMRFRKGSYGYVVYSGVGRWGPKGESIEKAGLAVENNGKVIANLKCSGRNEGEMGPQWFEKAGYQRSDKEEFFIPD